MVTRAVWQLCPWRHLRRGSRAYPLGIDDESNFPDEVTELPEEDDSLEIHPDAFMVKSGFLRAGDEPNVPPPAPEGPPWTFGEADDMAHEFLVAVAGARAMPEFIDDPVEHARANGLMLLFSEGVQESFETYLVRMPEPRVEAWRDLIAGGASSEAFGPLTLQEKLSDQQIDDALEAGRRQRTINLVMAGVLIVALGVGFVFLYGWIFGEEERTQGAFHFAALEEEAEIAARGGGPPVAEPALTTTLSTTVAVAAGDGS